MLPNARSPVYIPIRDLFYSCCTSCGSAEFYVVANEKSVFCWSRLRGWQPRGLGPQCGPPGLLHPRLRGARFRRQGDSGQPGRLAQQTSELARQAAGICRRFRIRVQDEGAVAEARRCRHGLPRRKGDGSKPHVGKRYGNDREVRDCTDRSCKVQNRRVVSNLRTKPDEP